MLVCCVYLFLRLYLVCVSTYFCLAGRHIYTHNLLTITNAETFNVFALFRQRIYYSFLVLYSLPYLYACVCLFCLSITYFECVAHAADIPKTAFTSPNHPTKYRNIKALEQKHCSTVNGYNEFSISSSSALINIIIIYKQNNTHTN